MTLIVLRNTIFKMINIWQHHVWIDMQKRLASVHSIIGRGSLIPWRLPLQGKPVVDAISNSANTSRLSFPTVNHNACHRDSFLRVLQVDSVRHDGSTTGAGATAPRLSKLIEGWSCKHGQSCNLQMTECQKRLRTYNRSRCPSRGRR